MDVPSESDQAAASEPASAMYVWVNPASTVLPLRRSPLRLAVGTPPGQSSNSWKVWVRGNDAYVTCRDNFQDFKVSLHASGIWRVAFTEKLAESRPDIVAEGEDRVLKKWTPNFNDAKRASIGFQIVAPPQSLYLKPGERTSWPSTVAFVEPPVDAGKMTVISVTVVQGQRPIVFPRETQGVVIGIVPLGKNRTIQIVATYDDAAEMLQVIQDALGRVVSQVGDSRALPDKGVLLVHGNRGDDIPWISAVGFRKEEKRQRR